MQNFQILTTLLTFFLVVVTSLPTTLNDVTVGTTNVGFSPIRPDIVMASSNSAEADAARAMAKLRRQDQVGCTGNALDPSTKDSALDEMCKAYSSVQPWNYIWECSFRNSDPKIGVFVYECNYHLDSRPCVLDEANGAVNAIFTACGENQSGWWFNPDWNKSYGIDVLGAGFCTNIPWCKTYQPGPGCVSTQ